VIVRLYQADGPWPNLALLKAATWHKAQGHDVAWWSPLIDQPDLLLVSKVFKDPVLMPEMPDCEVWFGGTGYALDSAMPGGVEAACPDYSLAPAEFPHAIGFTSRGCVRKCPWCVVPAKEGHWHPVTDDIRTFWTGQESIVLLDNNLTADEDHLVRIVGQIVELGLAVEFSQGLDVRLVTAAMARALAHTKPIGRKRLKFAMDSPGMERIVARKVAMMKREGVAGDRLQFYVLVGFDTTPEQDMERLEFLESLGVYAFVMPFDRSNPYQRDLARWNNHQAIRASCSFDEYRRNTKKPEQCAGQEAMAL
jgi:hypothetical protein